MNREDELKIENEKLKKEIAEIKEINKKYLQNVAHQLTAPLGAIKWSIESIQNSSLSISKRQQLLRSVYSQATILVHLIKNFSLMSNLEVDHELGEFKRELEPEDVLRLAINLANDFQPQAAEQEKKITVKDSSFKEVFKDRPIPIVKNLIAQAISNILENAVKYADSDTQIVIEAERTESGLGVSVTSIGIPIKAEEVKKLTERGFRGNDARQKIAPGTGIGLYLANQIIRLHGGSLNIRAEGKKSKFTLVFPAK